MSTSTRSPEPLGYSVDQVMRIAPFGRTRIYQLINEGKLESCLVGKRRIISAASLRRLVTGDAA